MEKTKRSKHTDIEKKWTFKQISYALLQGNARFYAENPTLWMRDANDLTNYMMTTIELATEEQHGNA